MSDLSFAIVAGAETIDLGADAANGEEFVLLTGMAGLGIPPVENRFAEGVGDGARYDGRRTRPRDLDLPFLIRGADQRSVEDNLRRLSRVFLAEGEVMPKFTATYPSGERLELGFVYVSGAEPGFHGQSGDTFSTWEVRLRCPDPYWVARNARSFSVRAAVGGTPFLSDMAMLPVVSSNAFGQQSVENPGDAPAYVETVITGPSTGVTSVSVNGSGWVFTEPLGTGEVVTISRDGDGVRAIDQVGANRYGAFAPAPKFPMLPPGQSTVEVVMVGATADSRIDFVYRPRFGVVF